MPYSVKGFFEINEDMVQILLMLEVLFTQNSKVEDLQFSRNQIGPTTINNATNNNADLHYFSAC